MIKRLASYIASIFFKSKKTMRTVYPNGSISVDTKMLLESKKVREQLDELKELRDKGII